MDSARHIIVFSDLDGTLLDHQTYSWSAASDALDVLRQKRIPLVLASSKTAAEMTTIRDAMGFSHCPAIVENGAGILPADGQALPSAETSDRQRLLAVLKHLPDEIASGFRGFSQMSVAEIAERTGLGESEAEKAADRQFSEPGLWQGSQAERDLFVEKIATHGITATMGGRFLTLSFGADKAARMAEITRALSQGDDGLTIALGDAPNDIAMLEAADFGVIVRNDGHEKLPELKAERTGRIIRTEKAGPAGWNESVPSIVSAIERGDLS